jgi:hypothetical protein
LVFADDRAPLRALPVEDRHGLEGVTGYEKLATERLHTF